MLSIEQSREIVEKVRDEIREDDSEGAVDAALTSRGVNPEALANLRLVAEITLGPAGSALVDASVLAGAALGQAALQVESEA